LSGAKAKTDPRAVERDAAFCVMAADPRTR